MGLIRMGFRSNSCRENCIFHFKSIERVKRRDKRQRVVIRAGAHFKKFKLLKYLKILKSALKTFFKKHFRNQNGFSVF